MCITLQVVVVQGNETPRVVDNLWITCEEWRVEEGTNE